MQVILIPREVVGFVVYDRIQYIALMLYHQLMISKKVDFNININS